MTAEIRRPNMLVVAICVGVSLACCVTMALGMWIGSRGSNTIPLPPIMAATAATGTNMAMATGAIDDDSEGVFFLDFTTGDLQCLVYYPRARAFGAHFVANVSTHLGAGRNSQYLMVTGQASPPPTAGGARPAASLVYVTDVTSGMFAAYAVPWNRTAESAGQPQSGALVYVGGGPIRNFQLGNANQPAAIVDPKNK